MKKRLLSLSTAFIMLLSAIILSCFSVVYADDSSEEIIFASDFEDGNMDDWTPFGGGGKLSIYSKSAHESQNCLKITERYQSYHGPSITADSLFTPEKTYNFSSWVYQNSDSVKTIMWTLRYVDSLGTSQYVQISGADIEPGVWTELSGPVTIPEDSVAYLLYFECSNAETDFFIDDVKITGEAIAEKDTSAVKNGCIYSFDFEEGNELWAPRGDNRLIRTDEYHHTGTHSIFVTNRNKTWNGPTVNINNVERGKSYFYSAYILYNGNEYENSHPFRMELQYNLNGEAVYQLITEKVVRKNYWTRITGTFILPEHAADVAFYIQTANLEEGAELTNNDLMSFYTDTVTISETSAVHKNTAITSFLILAAAIAVSLLIRFAFITVVTSSEKKKNALKSISKDAMTQALNRNAYEKKIELLEKEPELCKSLFFALCDVNFLKYINDNHGHEKGDEAITRCAKILMEAVGESGEVYRTGGDEFVCITEKPVQDKIHEAIERESAVDNGYPFAVASGFAEYDKELDTETPDIKAIIERCDQEMYANKQDIKSRNKDYSRK